MRMTGASGSARQLLQRAARPTRGCLRDRSIRIRRAECRAPPAAGRGSGAPFVVQSVDDAALEPFEADRRRLENRGHVIGRRKRVRIAEADEHAVLRAVDEPQRRAEHDRARAFGADERPGDMEAVLGKKLIEVVARDAARNLRKAAADLSADTDRESIGAPRRSRRGGRPRE